MLRPLLIAVLPLFLAMLAGCDETVAETAEVPTAQKVTSVEFITIAPRTGGNATTAIGQTVYKREASLGFGSPGEIMSIKVEEGDVVRRGQLIATLRRLNVGADEAEADLVRQTAENNYRRLQELHESGAVSDVALEDARLALERSRQNLTITAPRNGVVLMRSVERGQVVAAGQPVVVIGEESEGVVARVFVSADQLKHLKREQAVTVTIKDRGDRVGVITRLSPSSSNAGLFPVEISFEKREGLRAGEIVEAWFAEESADPAEVSGESIVPSIALVDARADQGVVYVIDDENVAHRRAVQTGGVNQDGVVIISGLEPDEKVVTRGASLLRDGARVRLAE